MPQAPTVASHLPERAPSTLRAVSFRATTNLVNRLFLCLATGTPKMNELTQGRAALEIEQGGRTKVRPLSRHELLAALGGPEQLGYDPHGIFMVEGPRQRQVRVRLADRWDAQAPRISELLLTLSPTSPLTLLRIEIRTDAPGTPEVPR